WPKADIASCTACPLVGKADIDDCQTILSFAQAYPRTTPILSLDSLSKTRISLPAPAAHLSYCRATLHRNWQLKERGECIALLWPVLGSLGPKLGPSRCNRTACAASASKAFMCAAYLILPGNVPPRRRVGFRALSVPRPPKTDSDESPKGL